MRFSLATWNINSVRSRMTLVKRFVKSYRPDVLCLQEIKCSDADFPVEAFRSLGFEHIELNGQKAYHGVGIFSRIPVERVDTRDFNGSGEARHISVSLGKRGSRTILHNFYVPAGGDIPHAAANPKFAQKLAFLRAMAQWNGLSGAERNRSILVGDLNVAPLETDVWSHRQLLRVVSHTPVEVAHIEAIQRAHGWVDVMREHVPPEEQLFTWWSYRARDWRKSNRGRRLDHVWVTLPLKGAAISLKVIDEARDWEKPSDHVPVLAEFDLAAR